MNICTSFLQARWLRGTLLHTVQSYRNLYSAQSLGMTEYNRVRDQYNNMSADSLQIFQNSMKEICSPECATLVNTDDLKKLIHVVSNDEDVKLLESVLSKFNKQNRRLRFGKYVFGPVIMRMFHFLNKPNEALCAYLNPELEGMFDELTTHVVLMDLLFENKMYQEVIEVYKITREKQYTFGKFPKTIMVPLFGAVYKLNTEESFKYMLDLIQEMRAANHLPLRRVTCFSAALALRQDNPQMALDLVSSIHNQGFFLIRSIKALATCALNQLDETLVILSSVMTIDTPTKHTHTFPADVIKVVEDHINKSNRKDCIMEFQRIRKQLENFNHISEESLDDILCSEFTVYKPVNNMKKVVNASLDESPYEFTHKKNFRISRPGLRDMP